MGVALARYLGGCSAGLFDLLIDVVLLHLRFLRSREGWEGGGVGGAKGDGRGT